MGDEERGHTPHAAFWRAFGIIVAALFVASLVAIWFISGIANVIEKAG